MKKYIDKTIFALVSLLLLAACQNPSVLLESSISSSGDSSISSSGQKIYSAKTINILDNISLFNVQGRYDYLDSGISCDWSGSTLEFQADCEGEVSINITSSYTNYDESSNGKRGLTLFSVFIDGERTERNLEVDNTTKDLIVATDLVKGIHTFKLVRQTNVYMSLASLNTITLKGDLIKTSSRKKLIEFIGDSYTTGYSLQGVKDGGGYDTSLDDPLDAYAYQCALNLDSDYMLTAFSGAGFSYGYTPFSVPTAYKYQNYFRDADKSFQPDRIPDLIVVNLGTNDVAQVGFNNNHAQIEKGVKDLINETYDVYGSYLPLIFCTDATHENNDPVIKEAMDSLLPDVKYEFGYLTTNNHANNYHPNAELGHTQGKELATIIKEYLPSVF